MIFKIEKLHVLNDVSTLVIDIEGKRIEVSSVGGGTKIDSDCIIQPQDRLLISSIINKKSVVFGLDTIRELGFDCASVFGDGIQIKGAICVDINRMLVDIMDDKFGDPFLMANGESMAAITNNYCHIKVVSDCGRFCVERNLKPSKPEE